MLMCLGTAQTTHAQVIRGRALTPRDSQPIPGAVVLLVDSTGGITARALADERGTFTLRAPASGTFRLRALRIGFRPSTSGPFVASRTEITTHDTVMSGVAVVLDVTRVVADSRCAAYRDSATAAYGVWEQAGTALLSSLLARASNTYDIDVVRVQRQYSVRGDSLLSSTETEMRGTTSRSFVTHAAERLAKDGYVTRDASGVLYAGPDEEVLLSDGFAETHCMRLEDRVGEPGTIALTFAPTPDRRLPDIAGRLIIDRTTGLLRRLDFTYVNLPREEAIAEAGGTTSFRRLPSGGWIVEHWSIRMPLFQQRTVKTLAAGRSIHEATARTETRLEVVAVQVEGGEVSRIARGATVVWTGPQVPFVGRLTDSAGAPMPNATISVLGTSVTATSDSTGQVRGPMTRPGRKQLRIAVPLLDSLALPPVIAEVTQDARGTEWIVRVPSRAQWLAKVCEAKKRVNDRTGFLRGTTRTTAGGRLAGATVVVSWPEYVANEFIRRTLTTVSTSTGDYQFCGVPFGSMLEVVVRAPDGSGGSTELIIGANAGVAVTDVRTGVRVTMSR